MIQVASKLARSCKIDFKHRMDCVIATKFPSHDDNMPLSACKADKDDKKLKRTMYTGGSICLGLTYKYEH
jgi:hypothetical protein